MCEGLRNMSGFLVPGPAFAKRRRDHDDLGGAVGSEPRCAAPPGAPSLPGGRWRAAHPLGLQWAVMVSGDGDGGELRHFADGGWNMAATFPATIDLSTNVLEVMVPRSALDPAH